MLNYEWKESQKILTLNVEIITVAHSGLEKDSNRVRQLLVSFVAKGWKGVVLKVTTADFEIFDERMSEGVWPILARKRSRNSLR